MNKISIFYSKSFILFIAGVSFFAAGFLLAWYLQTHYFLAPAPRGSMIREGQEGFINPLLSCEIAEEKEFYEFKPLKDKADSFIQKNIDNGKAKAVSVYFRTLNSGRWFGINQNQKFSPSSLLKIPVMIAYFKLAENNPEIFSKNIVYQGIRDRNASEYIKSSHILEQGKTYTIEDLISRMIIYSDNNAQDLLKRNLDQNYLKEVYTDLGLTMPQSSDDIDFMSSKTYAFLFRVLYGATYLNRFYSNKALEFLHRVEFKDALVAGLPAQTTVAHKFGERSVLTSSGSVEFRELHDCGIVYYPGHPYLICIMTQGHDFENLKDVIKDISGTIYNETSNFFRG